MIYHLREIHIGPAIGLVYDSTLKIQETSGDPSHVLINPIFFNGILNIHTHIYYACQSLLVFKIF